MTIKTFQVPNISCKHCVHTIEMELGDVEGIKNVRAFEGKKQVTVEYAAPASEETIVKLLTEINYPPA